MLYKKELNDYAKNKRKEINKILSSCHKMNKDETSQYEKADYFEFYKEAPQEEIAQENDYVEYLNFLKEL